MNNKQKDKIMTIVCGNCVYWDKYQGYFGECRRHAPTVIQNQKNGINHEFPLTATGDWCGDGVLKQEDAE